MPIRPRTLCPRNFNDDALGQSVPYYLSLFYIPQTGTKNLAAELMEYFVYLTTHLDLI
jgi:hypothetical protein